MNKLLCLSCILLLTYIKSVGQQQTAEPPKKASKIIVMARDTANGLLDKLTVVLFDKGFTVDNKDEKGKIISTKEKSSHNGSMLTRVQARINDTAIVFTSTMALGFEMNIMGTTMKQTFDPVKYTGLKGSYMRLAWNELDAIAHQFGDKIVYSK